MAKLNEVKGILIEIGSVIVYTGLTLVATFLIMR